MLNTQEKYLLTITFIRNPFCELTKNVVYVETLNDVLKTWEKCESHWEVEAELKINKHNIYLLRMWVRKNLFKGYISRLSTQLTALQLAIHCRSLP